jgi:hypothetical protein
VGRSGSKEGYELMAAMFAFGGVGVVMGVMHWTKQQRSSGHMYSALRDDGVPMKEVRGAGYGALGGDAGESPLPQPAHDDVWGRTSSYQEAAQAL